MENQINGSVNYFLSPHLRGCRKGCNTQHAFSVLTEKSKNNLGDKGFRERAV